MFCPPFPFVFDRAMKMGHSICTLCVCVCVCVSVCVVDSKIQLGPDCCLDLFVDSQNLQRYLIICTHCPLSLSLSFSRSLSLSLSLMTLRLCIHPIWRRRRVSKNKH